jgi:hypothetical protein
MRDYSRALKDQLIPLYVERRRLRQSLVRSFPCRPAERPRFDGELTVAAYTAAGRELRFALHHRLDLVHKQIAVLVRERDEIERELEYLERQ